MAGGGGGKRKKGGGDIINYAAARPAASCIANIIIAVVVLLLAVLFFMLPPQQTTPTGGGGPREQVELAIGVAGHEGWLDAVRAWAKLACLRLRPAAGGPAAKKSLEMGKEAMEHTAESAARATEEALERKTQTSEQNQFWPG